MSDKAFEKVFDELMNEIMLEFAFQAHKAFKAGFFQTKKKTENEDIYGLVKGKVKMPIIVCPKCGNRKFEPSRMASHLSDCMVGKGRASSRKATKKLNSINDESDDCDYENDDLSFPSSSKKKTKKKPGQANPRKRNNPNKISVDQFCGAMTKNSKKQCMNSKNCHQHSEQQIQSIPVTHPIEPKKEDVQIDVDTVDEENDVYVSQIFSTSASFEMYKKFSE